MGIKDISWSLTPEGYIIKGEVVAKVEAGSKRGMLRVAILAVFPQSVQYHNTHYRPGGSLLVADLPQHTALPVLIDCEEGRYTTFLKAHKEATRAISPQKELPNTQSWHGAGRSYTKGGE